MERTKRNPLLALICTLLVSLAAIGAAQASVSYSYDIIQFGQTVGMTSMAVQRGPGGYVTDSAVLIPGVFDVENQLTARPDGSALSYTLQGVAQGAQFRIDVEFTDAGAQLTFAQGGATQSVSLPSEAPLLVTDNNFIEGFQLAADQVMASGQPQQFTAVVPQAATLAALSLEAPKAGTVEYLGGTVDVTQIDAAYGVAGQVLAITIYLDDAGDILVLEQQPGGVRFVRQLEQEGGAAPAAAEPEATAQAALEASAACVVERDVSIGSTGETLAGRLTLPVAATVEGGAPAPTLLILPGSGSVDMDGNVPPLIVNGMYKQLAYELACNGYGALRVSKLGIPPSTGDGNAVTLDTYAHNTADWLAFLAEQPGVDAARLGLIGHSEGGLVALYAVAEGLAEPAAVVLLASPGRPFDVLLREQLLASFQRSGLSGESLDDLMRQTDEALEAIRGVEGAALTLDGELADNQIAGAFAHAAGLLRSEMEQDPVLLAGQVRVPTLVLQGLKDLQVLQVDGRNLAGALPRVTLLEFPDMGHNMNHVAGEPESGALPGPDAVVYPTMVRSLVTWLNGYLRTAR